MYMYIYLSQKPRYYPPKHLDMLFKKQVTYGLPQWQQQLNTVANGNAKKPVEIKSISRQEYDSMLESRSIKNNLKVRVVEGLGLNLMGEWVGDMGGSHYSYTWNCVKEQVKGFSLWV